MAATVEHRALGRLIQPRTVIDIGANKGQFALFALGVWSDCRVYSFEPLPGPARRFEKATKRYPKVRLFKAAIGPTSGEALIHLSQREDSSSLLPISQRMVEYFPEAQASGRTATVRVGPLDDFLDLSAVKRPALLKLDVQGYELEALRGCATLLGVVDWLYVECSEVALYEGQALRADVERFLDGRGFTAYQRLNPVWQTGAGLVQCDVLFCRAASETGSAH